METLIKVIIIFFYFWSINFQLPKFKLSICINLMQPKHIDQMIENWSL